MSIIDTFGGKVASAALALLGTWAGVAQFAEATPAPDAPAVSVVAPTAVQEDAPGFNCATMGNHVCGPDNSEGVAAGCYDDGALVVPWSRYDDPSQDTLYGQLTSPCEGQAPTQEQDSDAAYAAAQVQSVSFRAGSACSEPAKVPTGAPSSAPVPAPSTAPRPLVNVNTASVAELDALPGIGDVLAARIVAQRPYASVADLHRVARIPAKVFPLVTV